jgi:hypothetical protein
VTPPGWKFLERVRLVAPLGVQFWDATQGAVVGTGLSVEVFAENDPTRRFQAAANRSGVYSVRGLPGLRDYENGGALPAAFGPFVIEVNDPDGRFLPFHLVVTEPGLVKWDVPNNEPMVPLFSVPARVVPAGMAVVRARLVWVDPIDSTKQQPAAGAVLEITAGGTLVRGLADERGEVAVLFPYPTVDDPDPNVNPPPIVLPADRNWKIKVQARFATAATRPDLVTTLAAPHVQLMSKTDTKAIALTATLRYGKERILKTIDATTMKPLSELFLTT